ncbi:MAG TPA: uridine kinase [Lachnospiraceae bacterium]|jgi:uridine kinase|nr:uridine kinase [Lachnospiraceae bacterium]
MQTLTIREAAEVIKADAALLLKEKHDGPVIIAIDGRCGSGKTTLGKFVGERFGWTLVHMDDFYLQPFQRTGQRYKTPGENIDHERFIKEVLIPMKRGQDFDLRRYVFPTDEFLPVIHMKATPVCLVEGSYSLNTYLRPYYDWKFFVDIDKNRQQKRILARNGKEGLADFNARWIPLEELYFANCRVRECADRVISIDG